MAKPISGKQCQKARNLLKWNQRDLSTRCAVDMKRIDSFEKGVIRPYKGEMDAIMTAFEKEDIQFKANFEVELKQKSVQTTRINTDEAHDATQDYMGDIERQQERRKIVE